MASRLTVLLTFAIVASGLVWSCFAASTTLLLVDKDSGSPVPRATVKLSADNGSWEFETDAKGEASLADLPPGTYRVQIDKTAYLDPADLEGTGRFHRIPPTKGDRLLIGVVRAGVIGGEVTDEGGRPLSGMAVMATKRIQAAGQVRFVSVGAPAFTDDAGRYRLHHLPAGTYTVTVAPEGDVAASSLQGLVYYPGRSDASRAEFVELERGAELNSVHVRVPSEPPGSVAGSVSGIPEEWRGRRAFVAFIPQSGVRLPAETLIADGSGKFLAERIPPGEYHALAWGMTLGVDFSVPPEGTHTRYAVGSISVRAGERTEVDLRLSPAMRVEARLAPGAGTGGSCRGVESLRLRLESEWPESWTFQSRRAKDVVVWDDLPAGSYRFDVPDLEPACTFIGVQTADKKEAPRQVIALKSSTVLAVVTGAASGEVSGSIKAKGRPVKGANVGLWEEGERAFALVTETGIDGSFKFDRLPPGRYLLRPVEKPGAGANKAEATMERLRRRFTLENGQKIQVDVNLDEDE